MNQLLKILVMVSTLQQGFSQAPKHSELVALNGTNVYYESYGKGEPLFLLHGFTQSSISWRPFIADYSDDFEVYLVDLKGHGKSGIFKEKFSMKAAAEDLNALIKHLKLTSISAIGFSYGGDVLFQLALLNPTLIKSLISIGACGSWRVKEFPHWVEYLSYKNIANLPWMKEQQTSDEQIKAILEQMPNYDVSLSADELKSIQSKVLLVLGDKDDSLPLDYISFAMNNLPNSFLWIVPNSGHSVHKDKNKPAFVKVSKEFFDENWKK